MGFAFAAILLAVQSGITHTDLFIAGAAIVAASALVQLLLRKSLDKDYAERAETYRAALRRREDSVGIAQLLTYAGHPETVDSQTLNQLAWEVYLWLPAPVAAELTAALKEEGRDPRDALIRLRRYLHGPGDALTREQIPLW